MKIRRLTALFVVVLLTFSTVSADAVMASAEQETVEETAPETETDMTESDVDPDETVEEDAVLDEEADPETDEELEIIDAEEMTATQFNNATGMTLDANGGTFDDGEETRHKNTASADIYHFDIPTRDGYAFVGWYVSAECKDSEFLSDENSPYKLAAVPEEGTTLYAGWTDDYYTITYEMGEDAYYWGGSDENLLSSVTYYMPKTYSLAMGREVVTTYPLDLTYRGYYSPNEALIMPLDSHYTFAGFTEEDSNEVINLWTYEPRTDEMTLYVKLTKNRKVITLHANGDTEYFTDTFTFDNHTTETRHVPTMTITAKNSATYSTYVTLNSSCWKTLFSDEPRNAFAGWYLDADCETALTWYSDSACTTLWDGESGDRYFKLEDDIDLYAKWEGTNFIAYFDPNGGYYYDQVNDQRQEDAVQYGSAPGAQAVNTVNNPQNDDLHKRFTGWYDNEDCSGSPVFTTIGGYCDVSYTLTEDTTWYAGWEDAYHVVTFDLNGGILTAYTDPHTGKRIENVEKDRLVLGTLDEDYVFNVPLDEDLVWLDGTKDFKGWFTAPEGGDQVCIHPSYYLQEDITLYAQWYTAYTVTLDATGGRIKHYPDAHSDDYEWVATSAYRTNSEGKLGCGPDDTDVTWWAEGKPSGAYAFIGWYNSENGRTYTDLNLWMFAPTSDVTLTAQWVPIYTVTFDANGGTINPDAQSKVSYKTKKDGTLKDYVRSSKVVAPEASFFKGWYESGDETQTLITDSVLATYKPDSDVTLMAYYIPQYTVTFVAGEGRKVKYYSYGSYEYYDSLECKTNANGRLETRPSGIQLAEGEDENEIYWWWYLDGDETKKKIDPQYYIPQANVTLLIATRNIYTVTFDAGEGTFRNYNYEEKSIDSARTGENGKILSSYIPSGVKNGDKTFLGWYTQETGGVKIDPYEYQPTGNITLYAHYAKLPKVTFDAGEGTFQYYDEATHTTKQGSVAVYTANRDGGTDGWILSYGPYTPVLEGSEFVGWYLNDSKIDNIYSYCFLADCTLYARYRELAPRPPLPQVADVTASVPAGKVARGTLINLYCATPNARIFYTTDGNEPDPSNYAHIYNGNAIVLNKNTTIKAMAYKDPNEFRSGEVATFVYEVDEWGDAEEVKDLFEDGESAPETAWFVIDGQVYTQTGVVASLYSTTYTGNKITFSDKIEVYSGTTKLVENRDYTISYANNTAVATVDAMKKNKSIAPSVTIKGKGNYSGNTTFRFTIEPVAIQNVATITSEAVVPVAASSKAKLSATKPTVSFNGKKLTLNKDYALKYYRGDGVGEDALIGDEKAAAVEILDTADEVYTIQVVAAENSNFSGELGQTVLVKTYNGADKTQVQMSKLKVGNANGKSIRIAYDPNAVEPLTAEDLFDNSTDGAVPYGYVYVKKPSEPLLYGTDYTVRLTDDDNMSAGVHGFVIEGLDNYVGTKTGTYEITGTDLGKVKIAGLSTTVQYTGTAIELADLYTEDRAIQAQNREQDGEPAWRAVTLYTTTTEKVGKKSVTHYHSLEESHDNGLTGDYTVSMANTGVIGKFDLIFTGVNGCKGKLKKTITVKPYDVKKNTKAKILVAAEDAVYSKAGAKAAVTVTFDGQKLKEGIDYTVSYKNNAKVVLDHTTLLEKARPTAVVKGIGNFTGSNATAFFNITQVNLEDVATVSVADITYKANGKKGYFLATPKLLDNGKTISVGKNKDVDTFSQDAIRYFYAEDTVLTNDENEQKKAGDALVASDKIPAGTMIKVTVTLSISNANSPYCIEGGEETVTLTGFYRVIGAGKDIGKATAKIKQGVTFSFQNGSEVIPVGKDDIEVYFMVKRKKETLDPNDFEIVSVSNNRLRGTATITLRGRGEYGGTKTVTFKIGTSSL